GGRTGWGGPTGLGRFHPTVLLGRVYPQRGLAMAAVTANRRTGRSRPSSTDGGSPTGRPAGGPHGRGGPPGPDRPPPPRARDPGSSAARGASPVGPPGRRSGFRPGRPGRSGRRRRRTRVTGGPPARVGHRPVARDRRTSRGSPGGDTDGRGRRPRTVVWWPRPQKVRSPVRLGTASR